MDSRANILDSLNTIRSPIVTLKKVKANYNYDGSGLSKNPSTSSISYNCYERDNSYNSIIESDYSFIVKEVLLSRIVRTKIINDIKEMKKYFNKFRRVKNYPRKEDIIVGVFKLTKILNKRLTQYRLLFLNKIEENSFNKSLDDKLSVKDFNRKQLMKLRKIINKKILRVSFKKFLENKLISKIEEFNFEMENVISKKRKRIFFVNLKNHNKKSMLIMKKIEISCNVTNEVFMKCLKKFWSKFFLLEIKFYLMQIVVNRLRIKRSFKKIMQKATICLQFYKLHKNLRKKLNFNDNYLIYKAKSQIYQLEIYVILFNLQSKLALSFFRTYSSTFLNNMIEYMICKNKYKGEISNKKVILKLNKHMKYTSFQCYAYKSTYKNYIAIRAFFKLLNDLHFSRLNSTFKFIRKSYVLNKGKDILRKLLIRRLKSYSLFNSIKTGFAYLKYNNYHKIQMSKLLRLLFIKKINAYLKPASKVYRLMYLIKVTLVNNTLANWKFIRLILRKWSVLSLVNKVTSKKLAKLYENFQLEFLDTANGLTLCEDILEQQRQIILEK